jgi:hypothetical protein
MIINHKYRFIFVKTRKTAGTSIEIALSRYCGPDDIVTKITERDEATRAALGYQGPVNHLLPRERWTTRDWFRHYVRREEIRYRNHMPALEIRARIGPDIWNSYYKFCFERNPWDRTISAYYWDNRSLGQLPEFEPWLKSPKRSRIMSNWPLYAIDGQIAVDKVYRYEDLRGALDELVQRLSLPGPLELPDAKRQTRKDRRPYQELYSAQAREYVARVCAPEIEAFGYRF